MRGERRFVCRTAAIRDNAMRFVGELPLTDPPLEIVVRTHRTKRTLDQNARYFALLAIIGAELGYGSEELHEAFKREFLPHREIMLGDKTHVVSGSTARLAVKDFGEYMDKIESWAAQQGITLPARLEMVS